MRIRSCIAMAAMALIAVLLTGNTAVSAAPVFPSLIPLPDGFRPEGVATSPGGDFFVGSLADGAVYMGDLRTGAGDVLVPGVPGRVAVGLAHDQRRNRLFVAGGPTGMAHVYDARTGQELAALQLTASPATFVNDVVVTRGAAYFTDSFAAVLYRVPLAPNGSLAGGGVVETVPLSGDFVLGPGFNANGIDATPNSRWLIIVNSQSGLLYRVDPDTGVATEIDLGGTLVTSGDGILLDGRTLYVVRNFLNEIAVVDLDPSLLTGTVTGTITDPAFRIPTTIAEFGSSLYAVNARFDTLPAPGTEYEIVRVSKK